MTTEEVLQMHRSYARFALDTLGGDASYDECQEFLKPLFIEGASLDKVEFNTVNGELFEIKQSLPTKVNRDGEHIVRILQQERGMEFLRNVLKRLDRNELLKLLGLHEPA